jgi:hypothetical protein
MTKYWISICLIISSLGCIKPSNDEGTVIKNNITVDTSLIAVIPFNTYQTWIFNDCRSSKLNSTEIEKIETLFIECIDDFNLRAEKRFDKLNNKHPEYHFNKSDFIINVKKYKRQYFPVINNQGEKEVWINCFCTDVEKVMKFQNWKTVQLSVKDGGNCFFNFKVNLTTNKFYGFITNGEME